MFIIGCLFVFVFIVLQDPESALLASINLAVTTGAPKGWNPSQPLIIHKPPYPTEDLIRRSALYQLMTQSKSVQIQESFVKKTTEEETSNAEIQPAAPMRSRRKGVAGDKSKLLDLDLNPDM